MSAGGEDPLDDALRALGTRLRRTAPVVRPGAGIDDLRQRSARQGRYERVTRTAAVAAILLGATVVLATARTSAGEGVQTGDGAGRPPSGAHGAADIARPGASELSTTTTAPASTAPQRTAPPSSAGPAVPAPGPSPAAPSGNTPAGAGGGIRGVDFREGFAYPADTCRGDSPADAPMTVREGEYGRDGSVHLRVTAVVYGHVLGDGSEQAIVTLRCRGGSVAWLFTGDGPAGARRLAAVEADHESRDWLASQGIGALELEGVRIDGDEIVSYWESDADDSSKGSRYEVTLRQAWRGGGLERSGQPAISSR